MSTKNFADYVFKKTEKKDLFSKRSWRSWQNNNEIENNLSLKEAMDSAKLSYSKDIDAGFKILHLDPSIDIHKVPNNNEILDRLFEPYEYCSSYAKKGREIIFEVGTEEQTGVTNKLEELEFNLNKINSFCKKIITKSNLYSYSDWN